MSTFSDLAASRREWIDEVLAPWCRVAARADLLEAEAEWPDIAGKVDPAPTLWSWAWGRFPELVSAGIPGVDETHAVTVTFVDGRTATGFPDSRQTRAGQLFLVDAADLQVTHGPISIDDISDVRRG